MIYKLLLTGIGLALSYALARKLTDSQANARVKVKTGQASQQNRGRLRQDPVTGIYHPED
jgi:hypothetical protein